MSAEKKNQAKGEQVRGKIKETVGRAIRSPGLEAEGRAEQSKGDARHATEKAKDAFRH